MSLSLEWSSDAIARLPALLREIGCDVVAVQNHTSDKERVSWTVLSCTMGRGRAVASVYTHDRKGLGPVVTVSLDLRRLLQPWHWHADWSLVSDIADSIVRDGGTSLDDPD
jgi:hypothetical protein